MSEALKAARRIVDALKSPASLMGGETAILNTKDVGLVARALLTQAERGREDGLLTADQVMAEVEEVASEIVKKVLRQAYKDKGTIADVVLRDLALESVTMFRRKVPRDEAPLFVRRALKRSGQESWEK